MTDGAIPQPTWVLARHEVPLEGTQLPGSPKVCLCAACQELGYVDAETGYCRACWRCAILARP